MSTLGKVLVILVALALLGWIFLASLVAEHHANWGESVKKTNEEVAAIEPLLPPLQDQIDRKLAEVSLAQVSLDRARRNFRAEYAMAQREESDSKEGLIRVNYQKALVDEEIQKAKTRHDVRKQEVADFERDIAQEQTNVQGLIAENTKLRNELDSLQKAFLQTTEENRNYLDRLKKARTGSTKPRTTLGSLVR